MTYKSKMPEDLIPDSENYFEKDGKVIRKGTMAAALANAEIVEASDSSKDEKQEAINCLKELAPILKTMGLIKYLSWKNPIIQSIFDEAGNK